jgi:hypothetical protein
MQEGQYEAAIGIGRVLTVGKQQHHQKREQEGSGSKLLALHSALKERFSGTSLKLCTRSGT